MKIIQCIVLGILLWSAGSAAQAQIDQTLESSFVEKGSIIGTLIDQETSAPAPYCRIVLHATQLENTTFTNLTYENGSIIIIPAMYSRSTYSDAQGAFSFTNLWTGNHYYELEIQSPVYQQQTVSGSFSAGTNDWGIIEVSKRPFYFQRYFPVSLTSVSSAPITIDPSVVRTTVVNTTGRKAYMRFWLTGKLERRDDSEYYGCTSETILKLKKRRTRGHKMYATYRLAPGVNEIKLKMKDYGPDRVVSQIMINGGRSYMSPLMVSQSIVGFIPRRLYLNPILVTPGSGSSLTINQGSGSFGTISSGTLTINSGSSGTANFSSGLEMVNLNFSMSGQLFGPTNTISVADSVAP